ncbi:AraC family transcriptional regulator [Paenibacillus physcomitrellae]|nr:AraC family transcriptional regulator [Paenibacillus physcomitrellae]
MRERGKEDIPPELVSLRLMAGKLAKAEGENKVHIPFLSIYKHSLPSALASGVITPSYCLILQGAKTVHLGKEILSYQAGDFLASVIDVPATGQITGAVPEAPYLGLKVDFTIEEITAVMLESGFNKHFGNRQAQPGPAAFVGKSNADIIEIMTRLLKLLDKPDSLVAYLANLLKKELIFTLLAGEHGHLFFQRTLMDQEGTGIGKAIGWIKDNLSTAFAIEDLADMCSMSVSSFHHKFKAATTMGPLQYQKHLRLQEARRLLLNGVMNAGAAALHVGYESPSQFNREYRRLFGRPPAQDAKVMRSQLDAAGSLSI